MNIIDYKNLFIDPNTFDVETISYTKPILFYKVNRNMGIYYKKGTPENSVKSPDNTKHVKILPKKQKIIFQTPKMVVPFDIKEFKNEESGKSTYKMCLSFSTLTNLYNEDDIKHFYQFIKKTDTVNEDTVMEHKKEWGLPKKIEYKKSIQRLNKDFPPNMGINLPYDEKLKFLFKVYDEDAIESNISIIEKKSIVSVVLELTDLRFSNTDFRANWTVLQIRKFKPYSQIQEFFMSRCFIYDNNDAENKIQQELVAHNKKMQQLELYKIQQVQEKPVTPIQQPTPIQPVIQSVPQPITSSHFVPPSKHDLLNGLKMLKKTITIDKSKPLERNVIDILPMVNSSHTKSCIDTNLGSDEELKISSNKSKLKSKEIPITKIDTDVKLHIKKKPKPEEILNIHSDTDTDTDMKLHIKKKSKTNKDKSEELSTNSIGFDSSSESEIYIKEKPKRNKNKSEEILNTDSDIKKKSKK